MIGREQEITRASWVGILGNAFLSVLKIVAGFISGSLAVVADGVDSSTDIITSVITLITARILARPPNKKYPYGYEKADTIATKVLSFIIFFAGAQLLITTIRKFITGGHTEAPGKLALVVTVISIIGKLLLSWHQFRAGKKANSAMLIANGKNMQNDVIISGSVMLGLVFIYLLKLPVLDTITAFLVSIWVLRVAFNIFKETSLELMDGTKDCTIYEKIFDAIDAIEGAHHPHRVRARNIGHKIMIAIDLEVDGDLTLREAHEIAHKVESSIKSKIDNIFDVAIHIEPLGDEIEEKPFGIAKSNL
jgi:cation diffusion facilitator family transporter